MVVLRRLLPVSLGIWLAAAAGVAARILRSTSD
jgi:hypothetical protein